MHGAFDQGKYHRRTFLRTFVAGAATGALTSITGFSSETARDRSVGISLAWARNTLTISGRNIPGGAVDVWYIEAYCRSGSTHRAWNETVIPHTATLVAADNDGKHLHLLDRLEDGVVVNHTITAGTDEVTFELVAHNPTDRPSELHWAQPCIRIHRFTGSGCDDPRELVPAYARKCFIYIDGKLARLPTEPWATVALYTPGQVYRAPGVDPDDVNPRPLSQIVPSYGLTGCFSSDESTLMAVAWEPYQEIFQGVLCCLHSDFRVGGLASGEAKSIRGKIYFMENDQAALLKRYRADFPEQLL